MLISMLSMLWSMQSTFAAVTPSESVLGDWDLGANFAALRISMKDSESIFVQFCKRDVLLTQHVCDADTILYFNFSISTNDFIHDDSGNQHLHATIQIDANDPRVIHYNFKSDIGSGELTGKKI